MKLFHDMVIFIHVSVRFSHVWTVTALCYTDVSTFSTDTNASSCTLLSLSVGKSVRVGDLFRRVRCHDGASVTDVALPLGGNLSNSSGSLLFFILALTYGPNRKQVRVWNSTWTQSVQRHLKLFQWHQPYFMAVTVICGPIGWSLSYARISERWTLSEGCKVFGKTIDMWFSSYIWFTVHFLCFLLGILE